MPPPTRVGRARYPDGAVDRGRVVSISSPLEWIYCGAASERGHGSSPCCCSVRRGECSRCVSAAPVRAAPPARMPAAAGTPARPVPAMAITVLPRSWPRFRPARVLATSRYPSWRCPQHCFLPRVPSSPRRLPRPPSAQQRPPLSPPPLRSLPLLRRKRPEAKPFRPPDSGSADTRREPSATDDQPGHGGVLSPDGWPLHCQRIHSRAEGKPCATIAGVLP